jgi:hypothetical protein
MTTKQLLQLNPGSVVEDKHTGEYLLVKEPLLGINYLQCVNSNGKFVAIDVALQPNRLKVVRRA